MAQTGKARLVVAHFLNESFASQHQDPTSIYSGPLSQK